MARTGRAISPRRVRRWINQAASEAGIEIDDRKKRVINSILATMPTKHPNPTNIVIWSNRQVTRILSKFPEYKAEADLIRLRVRQEILYFMNEPEFQRLAILAQGAGKLRPHWIRQNAYALYLSTKRFSRRPDGQIDWQFVFDRLSVKKFSYRALRSYGGDKEKIIAGLKELLEAEDPAVFNPNWVYRHSGSVAKQISTVFKSDWAEVLSHLDEKWRDRFTHKRFPREIKFYRGKREFAALVKKHRGNLYPLYSTLDRADRHLRNAVALDFIAAAQKGNKLALDFLLDCLTMTVQADEQFNLWIGFEDLRLAKIKSCIFLFDIRKSPNFFAYLAKSLRMASLPFRGKEKFSLNCHVKDSQKELSEFLLTESQNQEVEEFIKDIKLALEAQ